MIFSLIINGASVLPFSSMGADTKKSNPAVALFCLLGGLIIENGKHYFGAVMESCPKSVYGIVTVLNL